MNLFFNNKKFLIYILFFIISITTLFIVYKFTHEKYFQYELARARIQQIIDLNRKYYSERSEMLALLSYIINSSGQDQFIKLDSNLKEINRMNLKENYNYLDYLTFVNNNQKNKEIEKSIFSQLIELNKNVKNKSLERVINQISYIDEIIYESQIDLNNEINDLLYLNDKNSSFLDNYFFM